MGDVDDFWGNAPAPRANFHELMASVGNLPPGEQARYGKGPAFGVAPPEDYIAPASGAGAGWWNEDSGSEKKKPIKKAKKQETSASSSSSVTSYNIPLVNMEAPSPLIFMVGLSVIMTITMIAEAVQMGGFAPMKDNPMYGPDLSTMLQMGAKYGPLIIEGEAWRLFSAALLQNGLIYYLLSMGFLFFCRNIERDGGFWRASLVFIVSASYGNILSCVFVPELISCGTTGAVFGYIGMMVSDLIAKWRSVNAPKIQLALLLGVIVVVIILGLTPFIDNFMHIGGLIMGFLAAVMLMPALNFGKCEGRVHSIMALVSFPVMSLVYMISLVVFFRRVDTDTSWCGWCMKATCVNISGWCKD
jgi:membrane associated rhomboid family serine protease